MRARTTNPVGALLLSTILVGAVLTPRMGNADGGGPKEDRKKAPGASAAPASPKYKEACSQGNAKYVAHDYAGAIQAYQSATEMAPKNPLAYYFLGEAQLAAGSLTEADSAWNRAALESGESDPALRAKILFVLADLRERQKKWEDARAAWQVYLDWAAKFPAASAFPTSGQSRQRVIDAMLKQDKAYEVVRQRIADTKNGGTFTDLSKSPPSGSK